MGKCLRCAQAMGSEASRVTAPSAPRFRTSFEKRADADSRFWSLRDQNAYSPLKGEEKRTGFKSEFFPKRTGSIAKRLIVLASLPSGDSVSGNFGNLRNRARHAWRRVSAPKKISPHEHGAQIHARLGPRPILMRLMRL